MLPIAMATYFINECFNFSNKSLYLYFSIWALEKIPTTFRNENRRRHRLPRKRCPSRKVCLLGKIWLLQKMILSTRGENLASGALYCSAPALRLRLVLSMAASHIKPLIPCLMHNTYTIILGYNLIIGG